MITDYESEIDTAARRHGLDVKLVRAVVLKESSGKTHAYRYEPSVAGWFGGNARAAGLVAARFGASYGLMQVLYATATDYGFVSAPEMLFLPQVGLDYGCRHLAALLKWAKGDVALALEAYNGGKGNANGHGSDADYARDVLSKWQALQAA